MPTCAYNLLRVNCLAIHFTQYITLSFLSRANRRADFYRETIRPRCDLAFIIRSPLKPYNGSIRSTSRFTAHLVHAHNITYSLRGDNNTEYGALELGARADDCDESFGKVINTMCLASRAINITREWDGLVTFSFNCIFTMQMPYTVVVSRITSFAYTRFYFSASQIVFTKIYIINFITM